MSEKDLIYRIQQIMRQIRQKTPVYTKSTWRHPSDLSLREDYLRGDKVNAASLTLFPTGCQYASHGGCTMCGEWSGSNLGKLVSPDFHVAQFASAVADLVSHNTINWLRIYQEGSFLNDAEIAPDAREVILRLASNLKDIRRITIESRPEYLTAKIASIVRESIKVSVELEIGIGLESKDDFVRNVCIGKGESLITFERAVKVAHDNRIIALAYVLLKPPFLSEGESIEETVRTVEYAFKVGFDEVYVQAASIHEWSLSEILMQKGLYSPPWLWSVLEVVKRTSNWGIVKIGGLEYFPRPSRVAQNYRANGTNEVCDCSQYIWHLIQTYNSTHNINLFADLSCSCHRYWYTLLETPNKSLPERISEILDLISVEDYLAIKREETVRIQSSDVSINE